MKYLVFIFGGEGPDVWDQEYTLDAADFSDACSQAHAKAEHIGGMVGSIQQYDSPDPSPNALAQRILAMCVKRNWNMGWSARGCYLHLEASELIEALRGKRGDPCEEAADVLIVLMSTTEAHGIEWESVLRAVKAKVSHLETAAPYVGESTQS